MTRILRTTATGAVGLAVCAGFGWLMAEVATTLNNHADHTPQKAGPL